MFNTFFAYLLNTYLIGARKKFRILKNGSDYQGAWPCSTGMYKKSNGDIYQELVDYLKNYRYNWTMHLRCMN